MGEDGVEDEIEGGVEVGVEDEIEGGGRGDHGRWDGG